MPHIHEKVDFTVEVFIVYKNKVLLRKHDKYKIWLGVGGHIELDEDPNQAAIREVKEEVGLDTTLLDTRVFKETSQGNIQLIPPISMNRHPINSAHEHISLVYFGTTSSDRLILEKENDECAWLTKEELEKMKDVRSDIKFYALKALEELSN
jgi:8-oxo-dGTP pyrophosphatase MutT (NUDIX family)